MKGKRPCKLGCIFFVEEDMGIVIIWSCRLMNKQIGYETDGDLLDPPGCDHWTDGAWDMRAIP